MAQKKIKEIIAALRVVLKKVRIVDGYSITIDDNALKNAFSRQAMESTDDSLYPKCFIVPEAGSILEDVASRTRKQQNFVLILVVKKLQDNQVPQDMINDVIDDIDRVINANSTLENTVVDAVITNWNCDGGVAHPEGIALINLETIYDFQR